MDLYAIARDEEKLNSITYVTEEAARIKGHITTFLNRLVDTFEEPSVKKRWGASIVLDGESQAAEIHSIFGTAVGGLSFVISDKESIEGRWIVRKSIMNSAGDTICVQVAVFRVTESGYVFIGVDQEHGIPARNRLFHSNNDDEAYRVASALLYAIGHAGA